MLELEINSGEDRLVVYEESIASLRRDRGAIISVFDASVGREAEIYLTLEQVEQLKEWL